MCLGTFLRKLKSMFMLSIYSKLLHLFSTEFHVFIPLLFKYYKTLIFFNQKIIEFHIHRNELCANKLLFAKRVVLGKPSDYFYFLKLVSDVFCANLGVNFMYGSHIMTFLFK